MSSHVEERRPKSRSRSRKRGKSKDRSPSERKRKKRSTAWDNTSVPSLQSSGAVPSGIPGSTSSEPHSGSHISVPQNQVYVGNITFGVSEDELRTAFGRCGAVRHVQLIQDAENHKAYSFVEYETSQAAEGALTTMDGYELSGRKLKVSRPISPAPARTLLQVSAPAIVPMLLGSDDSVALRHGFPILPNAKWGEPGVATPPPRYPLKAGAKAYVCGIPGNYKLDSIKTLFAQVGSVKNAEEGQKDGFRFVLLEFHSESAVERAISRLHNHSVGDQRLKVGRLLPSPVSPGLMFPGVATLPQSMPQDSIEDDQLMVSGGSARMALMRKLLREEPEPAVFKQFATQAAVPVPQPITLAAPPMTLVQAGQSPTPTRCVVLRNLVGSLAEVDDSLGEEVRDECSKYGKVEHLLIYDELNPITKAVDVYIFVLYTTLEGSYHATARLNNRFFAKRRIACNYFDERAFYRLTES